MAPTGPGAQQGPTNDWDQQGPGPNRAQQMNPLEWTQQGPGPNRAQQMNGPRARAQQGPMKEARIAVRQLCNNPLERLRHSRLER